MLLLLLSVGSQYNTCADNLADESIILKSEKYLYLAN